MAGFDPSLIWTACRPIIKILLLLAVGFITARRNILTTDGSKTLAALLVWVLYPCLLFSNVLAGIDADNLKVFGIMTLAAAINIALGLALGLAVLYLTNPPRDFRYGAVLATVMGNNSDLPLAIVSSVGASAPFASNGATVGAAYVSAFMCLTNLFFFSVGSLFGEDFRHLQDDADADGHHDNLPAPVTLVQAVDATKDSPPPPSDGNGGQVIIGDTRFLVSDHASISGATALASPVDDHHHDPLLRDSTSLGHDRAASPNELTVRTDATVAVAAAAAATHTAVRRTVPTTSLNADAPSTTASRTAADSAVAAVSLSIDDPHRGATFPAVAAAAPRRSLPRGAGRPATTTRRRRRRPFVLSARGKLLINSILSVANLAILFGLLCAAVPQLRALFLNPSLDASTSAGQPPLYIFYDASAYIGRAAVPMALTNLGAALGRLSLHSFPRPSVVAAVAVARLLVLPAVGVLCVRAVRAANLLGDDRMLYFVLMLQSCVPTASSCVFFTQLWHPRGEATNIAAVVVVQYAAAMVTMTVCVCVMLALVSS
ncbi:Protein M3 [Cladochytrium tenue]|nr:Protein M3 [Cladochytrium tenue]